MHQSLSASQLIMAASSKLEELAQDIVSRPQIPHISLSVAAMDGSASWSTAMGAADSAGRAMMPETPYFIASIDKLYNATIVHALIEEGLIALKTRLVDILPLESIGRIHVLKGRDYTDEITIEHLLGHSSGLADHLEDKRASGKSFVDEMVGAGQDHYLSRQESIDIVRDEMTSHFPPQNLRGGRAKIRYSDTNYVLLMEVIEAVTGQQVERVVTDRIFRPAGLRSTYYVGLTEPIDTVPEGAGLWAGEDELRIPKLLRAMRSVYSTAEDQVASLRYIYSGQCFKNAETRDQMMGGWRRFGFPTDVASLRAPSWPIEYGLGAMRFAPPAMFTGFRRNPTVVGHTGSTGTWLFLSPELEVVFAGAVDQVAAGPVPFRNVIPGVIKALTS